MVSGGFARQGEGGTQAPSTAAPYMFGDLFGARSLRVSYTGRAVAIFGRGSNTTLGDNSAGFTANPRANDTVQFTDANGNTRAPISVSSFAGGRNLDFTQALLPGGGLDTVFAQQALQTLFSTGNLTAEQLAQINRLTPTQRAQLLANRGQINGAITQALNGIALPNANVVSVTGADQGATVRYNIDLSSEALVALPGASTAVGRVKLSEDNSPLPRDRFIFAYDGFDGVPFTTTGLSVNRFQFGVEKTFFDGRWSAEFRLPFAGTLASNTVQGAEMTNTQLGNVRFALKRIATQSDFLTTSTGIGVTLPTAADQVLRSGFDNSTLYRFENRSVTVEPFIAALFTPNDRLFAQAWGSINLDTTGGELTWNPAVFGGNGSARIWDVPVLAVDAQVGYWLVRKECGILRGLAPFVELHWNYAIAQEELLREVNKRTGGNGLTVQGVGNQELNMVAGFTSQIGDNLLVSVAGGAPLFQRPDRTFDAQIGVRASYLFGRTARARNPISSIGSY